MKNIRTALCLLALLLLRGRALPAQELSRERIFAQKLVETIAVAHPELAIIALHVTPDGKFDNEIIASNIRRIIGKKSDEEDYQTIYTKKPKLTYQKDRGTFQVLLPLLDKSGKTIGSLTTIFKEGGKQSPQQFLKRAKRIRNEMRSQISTKAKLFETAEKSP